MNLSIYLSRQFTGAEVVHNFIWLGIAGHRDDRRARIELTNEGRCGDAVQLRHHDVLVKKGVRLENIALF